MYKKLAQKTVGGSDAGSIKQQTTAIFLRQQVLLDCIFQHVNKDKRPCLEVAICGIRITSLLDSEAIRTVLVALTKK